MTAEHPEGPLPVLLDFHFLEEKPGLLYLSQCLLNDFLLRFHFLYPPNMIDPGLSSSIIPFSDEFGTCPPKEADESDFTIGSFYAIISCVCQTVILSVAGISGMSQPSAQMVAGQGEATLRWLLYLFPGLHLI